MGIFNKQKKVRVAINGFGRIGRAFLKIAWNRPEIEIVAVNDLGTLESLAYLLKYDTVYRTWPHTIEISGTNMVISHHPVASDTPPRAGGEII